nr:hypothetical protein [Mangrovicoccus ximenensis]
MKFHSRRIVDTLLPMHGSDRLKRGLEMGEGLGAVERCRRDQRRNAPQGQTASKTASLLEEPSAISSFI